MNKIKSIAIGVMLALAVVWCVPNPLLAQSRPQGIGANTYTQTISVASGGGVGSDELSASARTTSPFGIPVGKGFYVYVTSSVGAGVDADSFHVFVQTRPSGVGNYPTAARSWMNLARIQAALDSTDYPLMFRLDPYLVRDTLVPATVQGQTQFQYYTGASLGEVRVLICGSDADTLADGAQSWPVWIGYDNTK